MLKGHRKELRGIKILKFGSNFYVIVKRGGGLVLHRLVKKKNAQRKNEQNG